MFGCKHIVLLLLATIYLSSGVAVHCNDVGAVSVLEADLLAPADLTTSNEQETCRACEVVASRMAKGVPYCQITCANVCKNQRNRNRFLVKVSEGATGLVNFAVDKSYKKCLKRSNRLGIKNCVCSFLLHDRYMPTAPKGRLFEKIEEVCHCRGRNAKLSVQVQIKVNKMKQKKFNVHSSVVKQYQNQLKKEKPKPQAKPKAKGKGKRALEFEIETLELKAQTLESKAEELEETAESME